MDTGSTMAQDLRCSGSSYEQAVGRQQSFAGSEQEGGFETFLLGFTMIESKGEKKQARLASFLSSFHLQVIKIKGWKAGLLGEKRASCSVLLA